MVFQSTTNPKCPPLADHVRARLDNFALHVASVESATRRAAKANSISEEPLTVRPVSSEVMKDNMKIRILSAVLFCFCLCRALTEVVLRLVYAL